MTLCSLRYGRSAQLQAANTHGSVRKFKITIDIGHHLEKYTTLRSLSFQLSRFFPTVTRVFPPTPAVDFSAISRQNPQSRVFCNKKKCRKVFPPSEKETFQSAVKSEEFFFVSCHLVTSFSDCLSSPSSPGLRSSSLFCFFFVNQHSQSEGKIYFMQLNFIILTHCARYL